MGIEDDINAHVEQNFPAGINVPTGVTEDEAIQAVQQQFADAGFDCPEDQAREIIQQAYEEQAAQRNALVAEGNHYARLKGAPDVKTERAFGDLWAERYAPNGWTIAGMGRLQVRLRTAARGRRTGLVAGANAPSSP